MGTIWSISEIKRKLQERKARHQNETPEQQAARRTATATWWIAIFTIVLAFVGGITLYEVIEGGSDTHALAVAAGKQAEAAILQAQGIESQTSAAAAQAIAAQTAADAATSAADTAKQTLTQTKVAMDRNASQSKAALDASIANSHLDQRPWLVPSGFHLSAEPSTNAGITVTVSMLDTGKTPAIETINQSILAIATVIPPLAVFRVPDPQNVNARSFIPPGIAGASFTTDPPLIPNDLLLAEYTNHRARLWLYAILRYSDTFQVPHWTRICAYHILGQIADQFSFCPTGNDLDHNQNPNDPGGPPGSDH